MSNFAMPVELYMSRPVYTISPGEDLEEAQQRLRGLAVSSLAVVDGAGALVGVISQTDLLRVGRRAAGSQPKSALLQLPGGDVAHSMTREVVSVDPAESVANAARLMVEKHMHRVYVVASGKLVGVLSTRDVMLSIRDTRSTEPIEKWMSSPVFSVRSDEPVSLATERLEKAHVTGLVVMADEWPVGLFTQREALESRDRSRDTRVEDAMNAAILILGVTTPLHRAAAQVAAMRVRRVVATRGRRVEGILTGIDFARAAL